MNKPTFIESLKWAPKDAEGRPRAQNKRGEWRTIIATNLPGDFPVACFDNSTFRLYRKDGEFCRDGVSHADLIPPTDPYEHLRAAQERGEMVEWLHGGFWHDGKGTLDFSNPPDHYRVAPKPELPPLPGPEWIRHYGVGRPVAGDVMTVVQFRNGHIPPQNVAESWIWDHCLSGNDGPDGVDIIAYRIVAPEPACPECPATIEQLQGALATARAERDEARKQLAEIAALAGRGQP